MLARGGRERQIVNRDNHYSPHFQVATSASFRVSALRATLPIGLPCYNPEVRPADRGVNEAARGGPAEQGREGGKG